jgi:hypothetical protein
VPVSELEGNNKMVTGAEITIGKQVIEQLGKLLNTFMNSREAKSIVSKVIREVCKGTDADLMQIKVWLKELEKLGASGKDYEVAKKLAAKINVTTKKPAAGKAVAKKPAAKKATAKKSAARKTSVRS